MSDEIEEQVEETPKDPEQELADAIEADALFAEELEPITVVVPKWEGCFFVLQPMDGLSLSRLYGAAQKIGTDASGKFRSEGFRVDAFERELVCQTVMDFCLKRKARVKGSDEKVWTEERASAQADVKLRPKHIRNTLCGDENAGRKGLAPGLWQWLVNQCYDANRMKPKAAGN